MWLANFEDGSAITSKSIFWTQLDKSRRITALQLSHPMFPSLQLSLSGLENYFFVKEAVTFMQGGGTFITAEIIGGMRYGVVTELRLDYPRVANPTSLAIPGALRSKIYPEAEYKYSREILITGKV